MEEATPDLAARIAHLERQNSELRAEIYVLTDTITLKEMGAFGRCAVRDCEDGWWRMSGIPLCKGHLRTAAYEYDAKVFQPLLHGMSAPEPVPEPERSSPAVYYFRMENRVKIGTTTNLRLRMNTMYVQPEQLLAIEPGSYEQEGKRHKQFAHLRVGRTELFDTNQALLDHIASVRSMFGDPLQFI